MVKVSIRDYMPPFTTWMQVELEDGVCNASQTIKSDNPNTIVDHPIEDYGKDAGVTTPYEISQGTWQ